MEDLPSFALLPSKPPPQKQKRQKRRDLPCPPELRYKEGEIINYSEHKRVTGGSSMFHCAPSDSIPLEPPFPSSFEELQPIIDAIGVQTTMKDVLSELYRTDGFSEATLCTKKTTLVRYSDGNTRKPQYFTQTLETPATVVHMITSGEFWDDSDDGFDIGKLRTHHKGKCAYTNGMLWCNSSPHWTWKTNDRNDTSIRCRIDLPAGTQVLIDRSPVYGGTTCEFDDNRGISLFPDVLLLPGQFQIVDMKRYKREGYESDDEDLAGEHEKDKIESLDVAGAKLPRTEPPMLMSDEEYASRMLRKTSNFIDVRLKVVRTMRVPDSSASP